MLQLPLAPELGRPAAVAGLGPAFISSRRLPVAVDEEDVPVGDVDGAIAALLCDLEIPIEIGNAFFIKLRYNILHTRLVNATEKPKLNAKK